MAFGKCIYLCIIDRLLQSENGGMEIVMRRIQIIGIQAGNSLYNI